MTAASSPLLLVSLPDLIALVRDALATHSPDAAPPLTQGDWLDTRGVAALLGVHPRSVPQYVRRGLPVRRLGPKTLRYERAAALAWLEGRKKR